MSTLITRVSDSAETQPEAVFNYSTEWGSLDVVHDLIGGGIAVTQIPTRPRTGTLKLVYGTAGDADDCVQLHIAGLDTFTFASSDEPTLDMTYVRLSVGLDADSSGAAWIVNLGYQEILP